MSISQFRNQIYAGVLGKIIGVYLGRPVEGWSYDKIWETFNEIKYYVHEKAGVPLIVADDDISGTFAFFRAQEDNGYDRELPARAFGDTWLNYIIENKTILWWGGLGRSTEHTAFLNLKNRMDAPESGSIKTNGASSAAWDTDCNAGNVGAFNGIRLGLDGINAGADFRTPVADLMYVVSSLEAPL